MSTAAIELTCFCPIWSFFIGIRTFPCYQPACIMIIIDKGNTIQGNKTVYFP